MLTSETKRKIDYLRDALVGKIPVPSDQINQITLGLIYKFMSDIDEQNEELGGKSFFSGEYKKYAWKNIMDRSLAGHERVLLYSEGLEQMSRNKEIPQLFRDIFKNAFLPLKDPAVLDLFLKGINEFKYEHSEELGNAFEYLLSTAAVQGKAGQFRTPRHIIDFIVEVVDPQKEDKILDPACGTAGFLISAYKHILENNTDKKSNKPGSLLTTTERKKLTKNIVGYDISHEMVRLSLVNLYLHGFAEPNIYEYDTLSSLDRWDDNFDCLLANPPFMTPRGGIKPHNRFSIQANKAEVLFVSYITEHLNPNGKAGIIVPEGIIFQSANAYKHLRKMLVEDGLWAVVSLPQGVFNPYAMVKTSILFFDNTIAKQTNEILFAKIENDGFDLGAQRRVIDKNDLPTRLELLRKYKQAVQQGKKFDLSKEEIKFASVVKKEKIVEDGEYNLSADRYLVPIDYPNGKWPTVKLREVSSLVKNKSKIGQWPYIEIGDIDVYSKKYTYKEKKSVVGSICSKKENIIISKVRPTRGAISKIEEDSLVISGGFSVLDVNKEKTLPDYLFAILRFSNKFFNYLGSRSKGATYPTCVDSDILSFEIPLPPIEVQKGIVAELDGYQKIIDGAKQVVDNYKPTIKIDSKWNIEKVGDLCEVFGGGTPSRSEKAYWGGNIPWISSRYFTDEHTIKGSEGITETGLKNSSSKIAPKGSTILITRVSVGKFAIADKNYAINQDLTALVIKDKNKLDNKYLWLISEIIANRIKANAQGIGVTGVTRDFIDKQEIPLPSLEVQKQIVEKIGEEQKMIEANKELVKLFEQKIKDKISELWGE